MLTVCYDGIAFGTVTVKIVGEDQAIIVTFVGDYTGTVEIAAGDTVELPTAPEGYYYTFLVNGVEFDPATPIYQNTTITVVLHEEEVTGPTLPGDIDDNGEVNMSDISLLFLYLNGAEPTLNEQGMLNADANGDGVISILDVSYIFSLVSNS